MSKRGGRFTQLLVFVDFWGTELISLGLIGRGKVQHKGRRRHFTDAEELRMEMEREKRKEEWRVKGFILSFMGFTNTEALKTIQRNTGNAERIHLILLNDVLKSREPACTF